MILCGFLREFGWSLLPWLYPFVCALMVCAFVIDPPPRDRSEQYPEGAAESRVRA